ncbi:MAG TPA: hypothetical protein VFQ53_17905 [Kofleriaceae bacterium]|nr:hypothetical protein [Kofleriaceae bacterium]
MTRPRQVLPGCFYLVTRRTAQQQYLLYPDATTRNAFRFCIERAATEHGIDVIGYCAMSNHYHAVIFDRYGNYPRFLELFHLLIARSMNTRWGRKDSFWSATQTSVVLLPNVETIVDKLAYTFTNPVKDLIVEDMSEWPGASGYRAFLSGKAVRATRPQFFFKGRNGTHPARVELQLVIPPELGDPDRFRARVQKAVELRLLELAWEREQAGTRCVGLAVALARTWRYIPDEPVARGGRATTISPTFASKERELRAYILAVRADFLDDYRAARELWLAHKKCEFPVGTYWLARHARVRVGEALIGPVVLLRG